MKSKIVLLGAIVTVVVVAVGALFMMNHYNIVEASNVVAQKKKVKLPTINMENMKLEEISEAISTEEPENEGATEEELQKEKVTITNHEASYYIIVNYASNVVTVYGKDGNNEYTVPVKAMVCSTGVATPKSGVYKLTNTRYKWRALFGGVYGQYAVKIVGNILFHSVPYLSTDNSTLEYWEYDKLGTSASAGCIRLTVTDALWIYNNCGSGTQVEFSSSASNPLGKPSARKISAYPELRGYDPTDPASNNPWRNANAYINKDEAQTPSNPPQKVEEIVTKPEVPKEEEKPIIPEKPKDPVEEDDKKDDKDDQDKEENKDKDTSIPEDTKDELKN